MLFDEEAHLPAYLPAPFRQIYQGDWRPLDVAGRPYTFVNFVTARDGRVSFAEPGHASGADISGFSAPDRWVMGLLRAGADAVMMGEGTLHAEPDRLSTSDFIFPDDAEAFAELRRHLGLSALPLNVFVSLNGELNPAAAVFCQPNQHVVVATTERGRAQAEAGCAAARPGSMCLRWAIRLPTWTRSYAHSTSATACERCSARAAHGSTARCCRPGWWTRNPDTEPADGRRGARHAPAKLGGGHRVRTGARATIDTHQPAPGGRSSLSALALDRKHALIVSILCPAA